MAKLNCYRIVIPECKVSTNVFSTDPKKAVKEMAKIEFERRGRTMFRMLNREFISATALANYLDENNLLSKYCTLVRTV